MSPNEKQRMFRPVDCSSLDDASLANVLGDTSAGDEFDIAPFFQYKSCSCSVYTVMFTDIEEIYILCFWYFAKWKTR